MRTITFTHTAELEMNSSIDAFTDEHADKTDSDDCCICNGCIERMTKSITNLQMREKERIYKKAVSPIINTILK